MKTVSETGTKRLKASESERELIKQAQAGDHDAFKILFETYGTKVYNFVLRMLSAPHDAEDVVQEVFVKMYRKLPTLRDPKFFSTWLFSIAKNESVNLINRQRKKAMHSIDDEHEKLAQRMVSEDDPEPGTPEARAETVEMEAILQQALDEIPEINRAAFVLGVIEGYSYKEVGRILGCSVNNVKSRVFRARAQLSEKLRPYFQG